VDGPVFKALADGSRRQLLDSLNERNGQTLGELCADLSMTRQSVSKHLAVLEAANLVGVVWRGREKLHYLNPIPINEISQRWISRYDRHRVDALSDLKRALEAPAMDKPAFVYITYIATTPERLWEALTDPAFTRRWWDTTLHTDWQPGSTMTWETRGITVVDPEQVVLEAEPFTRLAYTWHTFTPELAQASGRSDEVQAIVSGEPRSKVSFELEPIDQMVKLTVVHDGFEPGSTVVTMVSQGWPQLLSSIKSMLEVGEPLPVMTSSGFRKARGLSG
jgi:uncharacterized protein YndB with AHSA1/START domain/DNA-binding transcriptional ArsR family regulator